MACQNSTPVPRKEVNAVDSPIGNLDIAASNVSISSTTHPSQIFRLPLEIRQVIYGFVFGEREVDIQKRNGYFHACEPYTELIHCPNVRFQSQTPRLQRFPTKPSPLAIAATCQQFYHETVKVWYANVRFFFECTLCMEDFLEEIRGSNRDTIRHVGYLVPLNPTHTKTEEMLHRVSKFTNLNSLIFEDNKNSIYPPNAIEDWLERWKVETQNLLRLWNWLEIVILTSKTLRTRRNEAYPWKVILKSRELKVDKLTVELATTS